MSACQYYEFAALDRALSPREQRALRELSPTATASPEGAAFRLFAGDLAPAAPALLARRFDAMLHVDDWGTRELALRLPADHLSAAVLAPFCAGDVVTVAPAGGDVILDVRVEGRGGGVFEGEGWLPLLAPLRDHLALGDHRAAYVAWLVALQGDAVPGAAPEPPRPAGLRDLPPALADFARFFALDAVLLAVAARDDVLAPARRTAAALLDAADVRRRAIRARERRARRVAPHHRGLGLH